MKQPSFFVWLLLAAPLLGWLAIELGSFMTSLLWQNLHKLCELLLQQDTLLIALSISFLLAGSFAFYLILQNQKGDRFNHRLYLMNKKFQRKDYLKDQV